MKQTFFEGRKNPHELLDDTEDKPLKNEKELPPPSK